MTTTITSSSSCLSREQLNTVIDYFFNTFDMQYKLSVDVDYSCSYDCCDYGCDYEGICRCMTIENAHFETEFNSLPVSFDNIVGSSVVNPWIDQKDKQTVKPYGTISAVEFYMLSRFLSELTVYVSSSELEIEVCGGYYGDEIEGVYKENLSSDPAVVEVKEKIIDFLLMDEQQKVQTFLKTFFDANETEQYEWNVDKINIRDIKDTCHFKAVTMRGSEEYQEENYQIVRDENDNDTNMNILRWCLVGNMVPVVVIETSPDHYELVYGKTIMDEQFWNTKKRVIKCFVGRF